MNKRQILVAWEFNTASWAVAIKDAHAELGNDLWEYIGISKSRCMQWMNDTGTSTTAHPGMGVFLKIVDLLHLDPTDFFVMEEK